MDLARAALSLGLMAPIPLLSASEHETPLALVLKEDGGLPFLTCSFDDVQTECLWDSGSVLSSAPRLPPINSYPRIGNEERVRIRSLSYGGAIMGPAILALDTEGFQTLGMDLLSGKRLRLSAAPGPKVMLDEIGMTPFGLGKALALDSGRYLIRLSFGSRQVLALWDTGTAGTRVLRSFILSAPKGDFEPIVSGGRYRVRSIAIGNETFLSQEVLETRESLGARDLEAILGWDIIRQLEWQFDPVQGLWSASRPSA